jgi:DNA-binding NtrC family response regulator
MPSKLLIYGNRLQSGQWDKVLAAKPELFREMVHCDKPDLPDKKSEEGTAFIDLENPEFCRPEFLYKLAKSFEKLRIIGIADSFPEERTVEVARLGVCKIMSEKEYQSEIASHLKKQEVEERPKKPSHKPYDPEAIIGKTPEIVEIKKMIHHLRDVDYPNAILFGETGTGKDLLAKVMHYTGVRKDNQFIEVNCSAIPDELFESELFGHKKGAFTDAKSDKTGLFEFAHNGTIFLDEIGNLSLSAQAKLLKILESRKLRPLGGVEEKDNNVRVLAATNVNLGEAVANGGFRQDLLFRLNLIAIHLPSLRERKQDIPELASHNFQFYFTLYNKPRLIVTDDAIERLMEHSWPGNVRELRNVVERTVLLTKSDRITLKEINEALRSGRVSAKERRRIIIDIPEHGVTLRAIERQVAGEILNMVEWNRSAAARILGVSRARLRRIMEDNSLQENRRRAKRSGTN